MPQFDTTYFISQVFWLVISFAGLYFGIRYIVFPMFDSIFKEREKMIQVPVQKAEELIQDTNKMQEELTQKRERLAIKNMSKLNTVYKNSDLKMQENLKQEKECLIRSLERGGAKLDQDEKYVLKEKNIFIRYALKGKT